MKNIILIAILFFTQLFSINLFSQSNKSALSISHLTGDFYIYITYNLSDGEPYPSNSMYMVTTAGIVLFDTPWDSTQFQPLLDSLEKRHHQKVILCIPGHFHADRTAGLEFLKQKGIKTFSSKMTYDLCKLRNEKQAAFYFTKDTSFKIGNHQFQTYYPGAGHSKDNIVTWFPEEKILYGGCFIKSTETTSLGNIADANLTAWPASIEKTIQKFSHPKYVIPGHLSWENNKGLEHTLQLLQENNKQ
jgi:metallo-beta-lactamase class B